MRTDNPNVRSSFKDIFGEQSEFAEIISIQEPKSILITGAQGMLGNGIAQALDYLQSKSLLAKTQIFLLSRLWPPDVIRTWKKNVNFHLVPNAEISKIKNPIEIVIHAASPSNITQINSFKELQDVNLGLLKKIQELNPIRIVYISSGEVYRTGATLETKHSADFLMTNKRDWYPIAKLEAEFELEQFTLRQNASASSLRLFHTFGPGVKSDDGRSFADILWGAAINSEIILHSRGNQIRSFLYLSDAVEAILKVAFCSQSGYKTSNLGSDTPLSILGFSELVRSLTGSKIKFELNNNFVHSPNDYLVPTIESIKSYGWSPRIDLELGIERTIHWIKRLVDF